MRPPKRHAPNAARLDTPDSPRERGSVHYAADGFTTNGGVRLSASGQVHPGFVSRAERGTHKGWQEYINAARAPEIWLNPQVILAAATVTLIVALAAPPPNHRRWL